MPELNVESYHLRRRRKYKLQNAKTDRRRNGFIYKQAVRANSVIS